MKIVLGEPIAQVGVDRLSVVGEVVETRTREDLEREVVEADALIVRSSTRVDSTLIAGGRRLKVIGRAGIGVDNIDLDAATAAGVLVVNAPQANTVSAAEHTMALMLAVARNVAQADHDLRSGRWERSRYRGVELRGKTLGILGLGRIGTLVARYASAFGMHVIAHDPYVIAERALDGVALVSLEELFRRSDWISVHLPRNPATEGMIGRAAFEMMKPTVRIVNTSRGGIIDESALVQAIGQGRVAGAALDVYETEPLTDSPLFGLPQVVLTPHLGASTKEAQDRAGTDVADAVLAALRGELVASAVNLGVDAEVPADVQAFTALAEHLGSILVHLAGGLPSHLTVTAEGHLAGFAIRPLRLAAMKGALAVSTDERVSYVNVSFLADKKGLSVQETVTEETPEYVSALRLTGKRKDRTVTVAGTVVRGASLVTEIFDYSLELPLARHLLVVRNVRTPGMIGAVGTLLGHHGITITDMVLGRSQHRPGAALMALNLDRGVHAELLDELRTVEGVEEAITMELEV